MQLFSDRRLTSARRSRQSRTTTLVVFALSIVGRLSFADDSNAGVADENVARAETLADHGAAAAARGNYEQARQDFEDAYKLTRHATLLLGLGDAQMRTGRVVEAANSFRRYLDSALNVSIPQRATAERLLQKVAKRCAVLVVSSNLEDPVIYVDGVLLEAAGPSGSPYYIAPGEHLLLVRRAGYVDTSDTVVVDVGETKNVRFSLAPEPEPVIVAAPAPPPRPMTREPVAAPEPIRQEGSARTVVLVTGAAATAVASGLAAFFYLKGRSEDDDAAAIRGGLPKGICGSSPLPMAYASSCGELTSRVEDRNTHFVDARAALVTAGILGLGTVTALLLWPKPTGRDVTISFHPAAQCVGMTVAGSF
jgi:hypothetical protein